VLGLQAIEGEHARIDRIALGDKAKIFGEVPDPRAVGFVRRYLKFLTDFKQMTLVAAGRLADNEERPNVQTGVAPLLRDEQLADHLRLIRYSLALIARQDVDRQGVLGNRGVKPA